MKITQAFWRKTALLLFSAVVLLASGMATVRGQNPVSAISVELSTPTPGCTDDTWTATSLSGAPDGRVYHATVWTGSEMIIWGGLNYYAGYYQIYGTGSRYNPSTDTWTPISIVNAAEPRYLPLAVWTGNEMIIFGGSDNHNSPSNTGARYDPRTDVWVPMSEVNLPEPPRGYHTAVWTGSEMIVWGGFYNDGIDHWLKAGSRYNPSTDTWTPMSTTNAPDGISYPIAVWTGSEMIIWGGYGSDGINPNTSFNTGGRYNPVTDTWTATSTIGAPSGRTFHTGVWTGDQLIVWGGIFYDGSPNELYPNSGGRYNPVTDRWTPINTVNAPTPRDRHVAAWTGSEMIIWGGYGPYPPMPGYYAYWNTGGRYNPSTDSWTTTSTIDVIARVSHSGVWTGDQMIVWGGDAGLAIVNSGEKYCAQPPPLPTATPGPTPPPTGGNGSFVIGDLDAVVNHPVYFWGSQWSSRNHLSHGSAPSAFKGFANSIGNSTPNCGGIWRSDPGNSSGPPSSVQDFITVIASSSVAKSGPIISGNNRKIVVIRTDPGYGPNPGHAGTGTVVSVTCE